MAGIIILSEIETGTNGDILQGTRLQTVPQGGYLTFEIQATGNTIAEHFDVSIQLPSGDTPLEGVTVPTGDSSGGTLDEREMLKATFPVAQGGHTVFSSVLSAGAEELFWRVTYTPA